MKTAAQQREGDAAECEILAAQVRGGDAALHGSAGDGSDVAAGQAQPADVDTLGAGRQGAIGAKALQPYGGIAVGQACAVERARHVEIGGARKPGIAAHLHRAVVQFRDAQNRGSFRDGNAGVELERAMGRRQIVDSAREGNVRRARRQARGIYGDAIGFDGERRGDSHGQGMVAAHLEVERLNGNVAAITRTGEVVEEPRIQIVAAGGKRGLAAGCHGELASFQGEAADGQIEDGPDGRLAACFRDFRRGNIGAAIGAHDEVHLRRGHVEIGDIHVAFEKGDDFQPDGHRVGVK